MNKYTYVNTGGWRILTFQFGNLLGSKTFRLLSHLRNYVLTFLRTEEFGVIWNQRRRGDVIKSNKDELRGDKLCIFYHVILGSFELITRDRGGYRFPAILNLLSDVPSCFNFLINERRNLWHSCNSLTSLRYTLLRNTSRSRSRRKKSCFEWRMRAPCVPSEGSKTTMPKTLIVRSTAKSSIALNRNAITLA